MRKQTTNGKKATDQHSGIQNDRIREIQKVIASEEVKKKILEIGTINAHKSGVDRQSFVRKLIRGIPANRNSYNEFVRWIQSNKSQSVNE